MDKNEIIKILEDWNFWKRDLPTGIPRIYYLDRISKLAAGGQVVVVTGPRRSGKSYIMRQFARQLIEQGMNKNNILIINFEDPRFPELNAKSLVQIFEVYLEFLRPAGEVFVFLDEVQEVQGWEKWVCSLHELQKARLVVSGSNAKLLSKELATLLTGRHLDLAVSPLSFREYLLFNQITLKDELEVVSQAVTIKGLLRKYLEEGAYPEVVLSERKKEILLAYFDDVLNKDLIKRYKVRKAEKLKALSKFYLCQMAALATYHSAAKFLGLAADTVEKFSGFLETAYLLTLVKRFSYKIKEQEKSPRKVYVVDTGLANAIGFRVSENWGRMAENAVFSELERRQALNPNLELYFWKDIHHREVDFVLKEGLKVRQLIQVSWEVTRQNTRDREVRSLLKAMREFDLNEALIITEDQEFEETIKNRRLSFIPLWKWLLSG